MSKQQVRVAEWEEAVTSEEASLAKRRAVGGRQWVWCGCVWVDGCHLE